MPASANSLATSSTTEDNFIRAASLETLAIFGNKPNAIVRPLQHFLTDNGMSDSDNDPKKLPPPEEPVSKDLPKHAMAASHGFSSPQTKESAPFQPKKPLFITTVPRGIFLPPIQSLPAVPKQIYNSQPKIFQSFHNHDKTKLSDEFLHIKKCSSLSSSIESNLCSTLEQKASGPKKVKPYMNFIDKGLTGRRTILRDNNGNLQAPGRIIRGSNFNHMPAWNPHFAHAGLLSGKGDGEGVQKDMEARRRMMSRKVQPIRYHRNLIGTPPPIKGRRHENVQTEKYLEELFDRPPEFDACVQTDLFLQRPPTPTYVPAKSGIDVCTEIQDGDLFDFDSEVQPILEVLIGRTLEQAFVEVTHEEELSSLKEQQERLLAAREREEAEIKRLEAKERRISEEKRRRLLQDKITESIDTEMQERVTAAQLLQGHIASLLPEILHDLDPIKTDEDRERLEEQLKPWLAQQVAEEIGHMVDSKDLLEEIVKQVLKHRAELYCNLEASRKTSLEEPEAAEEEEQAVTGEEETPEPPEPQDT